MKVSYAKFRHLSVKIESSNTIKLEVASPGYGQGLRARARSSKLAHCTFRSFELVMHAYTSDYYFFPTMKAEIGPLFH